MPRLFTRQHAFVPARAGAGSSPVMTSKRHASHLASTLSPDDTVYIGLDVGTQGTKAVLYHPATSSVIGRAAVSYGLSPNPDNIVGRAEQSPSVWVDAVRTCLKSLGQKIDLRGSDDNSNGKDRYQLGGIGVSGQQHGFVPLDANLQPIRDAKLWCDVESFAQAERFSMEATQLMQRDWKITAGFTAPKVMWVRENEPEIWKKVRWCVLPHDYISLVLRGSDDGDNNDDLIPTTDAGDASGTGVLDPMTREYVKGLADVVDEEGSNRYFESLPRILGPSDISGYLGSDMKKELGIDPSTSDIKIPISVGSGDNMCSALGCGCVEPGMAVLSLGTSGTIFGVSDEPVQTGTPIAPFCDATGRHLPLACVMSCTGVLQSVLDNWCNADDSDNSDTYIGHEEATRLASVEPPGCTGLTFLPFLGGERTPNWPHATGALLGVTSANIGCMAGGKPGLIYRAAMEGITYLLADALEDMRMACGDGFQPKSLLVVGGGSKNVLWRQMISDVLGLELRFPLESESAALGAAFQAGAAANGLGIDEFVKSQQIEMEDVVVKSTANEEVRTLYKEALADYRRYSRRLFGNASTCD